MRRSIYIFSFFMLVLGVLPSASSAQTGFERPEDASAALLQALRSEDPEKARAIFGPGSETILSSGDPVQDKNDRQIFALAMEQSQRWVPKSKASKELIVGHEAWPFPVPLVRAGNVWRFDTNAGRREILARRIGRNEIAVMKLCGGYVHSQMAYASKGRDGNQPGTYAQKFRSAPGKQDGLYWPSKPGEEISPLGDLAAKAETEGYDREKNPGSPFHGYYFRILTSQGLAASGGAKSYIVNGNMTEGFALIAYPAEYKNSGVMTFIVNQDGIVYEKDLGSETLSLASQMQAFNPDATWAKADVPK